MTIAPGGTATMHLQFMMHQGMEGPHDFRIHLRTNDRVEPVKELVVLSDWVLR